MLGNLLGFAKSTLKPNLLHLHITIKHEIVAKICDDPSDTGYEGVIFSIPSFFAAFIKALSFVANGMPSRMASSR